MRQPPPLARFVHYPITAGTGLMAVGVTAASMTGRDVDPLYMNVLAFEGEPWRLVSSVLPHGSIVHLVFNLIWLWIFGTAIESVWGAARTLAIFLLFAVGTSLAEYAVLDGGIGLSGIGYGLFGLLAILTRTDPRFANCVDGRTVKLFIGWFLLCIALTLAHVLNIGNIAHGLGGVMGALLGLALSHRKLVTRIASGATIAILVGASAVGATVLRPRVNLSSTGGADSARLGYEELGTKNYADAARHLRRAIEITPTDDGSWYNLGVALGHLDDDTGELAAFREAAALQPDDADYKGQLSSRLVSRGVARSKAEDPAGALTFYQEALAISPSNVTAMFDLSLTYTKLERWPEALDAARKAYQLDKSPDYAQRLASALEDAGAQAELAADAPRAIALYTESVAVHDTSSVHNRLAELYARLGRDADAAAEIEKANR